MLYHTNIYLCTYIVLQCILSATISNQIVYLTTVVNRKHMCYICNAMLEFLYRTNLRYRTVLPLGVY